MSARDVIAAHVPHFGQADRILSALSAAGWVVAPREPTREMWAAAGNALVNGRVKLKANHDYLSETVWNAMTAAALPASPEAPR